MTGPPVAPARGLTSEQARRALEGAGPNRIHEPRRGSIVHELLEELREPMILLLLLTGALYSIWGRWEDAVTIFAVILVLVGVEVGNELRAERAVHALRELAEPTAAVLRDGGPVEIPVEDVAPLDVLLLSAGRRVAADARLVEAHGLGLDESTLTGESVTVDKRSEPERSSDGSDRSGLVFAGTTVVRGRGLAVVESTGMGTELGRVAGLAQEARPPRTPLQLAMTQLSRSLVVVAISISVVVPLLGWWVAGRPVREMVLTGLALAFATIPEELPIIITMVLALGGYRLARRRAIAKRLQAVETLGAVTLIVTDKTGTLTQNRLRVAATLPEDFSYRMLEIAASAVDPVTVDPMELALLEAAGEMGVDARAARRDVREQYPFDERRLSSALLAREPEHDVRAAVVGAPEAVLDRCAGRWTVRGARPMTSEARAELDGAVERLAREGLRILAAAERTFPLPGPADRDEAETALVFAGLIAMADPPRPGARRAVETARGAGIRVVMATGDLPATAAAVAEQIGLDGRHEVVTGPQIAERSSSELTDLLERTALFARIDPADKMRMVEAARTTGHVIAVTGDGVNDAPALASADVGVAMGRSGTDVAREAADIVLADDDFATIVTAVEEGRVLFGNLRKGVRYYLACKAALIGAMLVPAVLRLPLPFAPVQIILMELFMDLAASAAFVAEPGEEDLMRRPPRDPRGPFLDRAYVAGILVAAAGLFAAVMTAYLLTRRTDPGAARTAAFATWILGHFLLALNLRTEREPLLRLGVFGNRIMITWGAAAVACLLLVVLVPAVHEPLRTVALSPSQWALVALTSVMGTWWLEARRWLTYRRS